MLLVLQKISKVAEKRQDAWESILGTELSELRKCQGCASIKQKELCLSQTELLHIRRTQISNW